MTNSILKFEDDRLILIGHLHLTNVMSIYHASLKYLKHCSVIKIDFAFLESANSAGLALIVEWIKLANKLKKPLKLLNVPTNLMTIARVSKLDHVVFQYISNASEPVEKPEMSAF